MIQQIDFFEIAINLNILWFATWRKTFIVLQLMGSGKEEIVLWGNFHLELFVKIIVHCPWS